MGIHSLPLFGVAVVLLLLVAAPARASRCYGQSTRSFCGPSSKCVAGKGVVVGGLCDPSSTDVCCVAGSDAVCKNTGGTCVKESHCDVSTALSYPEMCPGSSNVVCCVKGTKPVAGGKLLRQKAKKGRKPSWKTLVKNKIADVTDYLISNMTTPDVPKDHKLCWPLSLNSTRKKTVTLVSWGASRENGMRCHAGVDMFTNTPGEVISITHGRVIKIFRKFTACSRGWGIPERGKESYTAAVMVHHPSLGKTVNYAELDPESLKVHPGQPIKKGQLLGTASYCGMLHFELYAGRQQKYHTWRPPAYAMGKLAPYGNVCAVRYLSSKSRNLLDPRPLLSQLEGHFCR